MSHRVTKSFAISARTANLVSSTVVAVCAILILAACSSDGDAQADPVRFCEVNRELEGLGEFTTSTPEDARAIIAQTRSLLSEAETTSPDEIKGAVQTTAAAYREILDFYADADFDVSPGAFEAALAEGDIGADPPEAQVVFGWVDENCIDQ